MRRSSTETKTGDATSAKKAALKDIIHEGEMQTKWVNVHELIHLQCDYVK